MAETHRVCGKTMRLILIADRMIESVLLTFDDIIIEILK